MEYYGNLYLVVSFLCVFLEMSGAPGPSSNKLAYWELEAEMEAREDPEFQPRDEEMEEAKESSSDDE